MAHISLRLSLDLKELNKEHIEEPLLHQDHTWPQCRVTWVQVFHVNGCQVRLLDGQAQKRERAQ